MISATLFHCLDDTIGSSLVFDRLNGPDHHKLYPLPSFKPSMQACSNDVLLIAYKVPDSCFFD